MPTGRPERQLARMATILRRRVLEPPAEVLVSAGAEVAPEHIVAQARREGDIHVVDVAAGLKVGQREARRYVVVQEGQWLAAGTILAQRRVFLEDPREVWAPVGGTIEALRGGLLFLRADPYLVRRRAHLAGRVEEVLEERGVVIRSVGRLLAGAWGAGGEARGPLRLCVRSADAPLGPECLAPEALGRGARGAIALGGVLEDASVLAAARAAGLAGLVVSSLLPRIAEAVATAGFPVLSVEGFGHIPWAGAVFEALAGDVGRQASLSATNADPAYGPELVIAVEEEEAGAAGEGQEDLVGAAVRLTRAPHAGEVGRVIGLPERVVLAETDLPGPAAEVRLEDGTRVVVPWVNLVVLA